MKDERLGYVESWFSKEDNEVIEWERHYMSGINILVI